VIWKFGRLRKTAPKLPIDLKLLVVSTCVGTENPIWANDRIRQAGEMIALIRLVLAVLVFAIQVESRLEAILSELPVQFPT